LVGAPPSKPPFLAGASSTLDACALNLECLAAVGSELAPAVAAPDVGGTIAVIATTENGKKTISETVAGVAVVEDIGLSGVLGYRIWQLEQNIKAQEKAKQRYCEAYPTDVVCPKQLSGIPYRITGDIYYESPSATIVGDYWQTVFKPWTYHIDSINNSGPYQPYGPIHATYIQLTPHPEYGKLAGATYAQQPAENYEWRLIVSWGDPANVQTWISGGDWTRPGQPPKLLNLKVFPLNGEPEPSGLPWKDWPQEKRSIAIAALKEPDWQEFIKSMPEGRRLNPGDRLDAPVIVLPGLDKDDPNTPIDERLTRKLPGSLTIPIPDLVPTPFTIPFA
jgi:hypothetical protein